MLTLYYAPDNASLILRLALEEAGLEYRTVLVDRAINEQKSPEYLALNSAGLIPTLVTPHGPLCETGACLLWLADTHAGAGLGPAADDPQRGPFLRWLFYISNTIHADLIRVFYPQRFAPPQALELHHRVMAGHLLRHFALIDEAVHENPALFAPPSALGLYLGPLLRWSALYPVDSERWIDLSRFPSLEALALSLEERPSVQVSARAEGLGDRPFSTPQLPQPPEGSAT